MYHYNYVDKQMVNNQRTNRVLQYTPLKLSLWENIKNKHCYHFQQSIIPTLGLGFPMILQTNVESAPSISLKSFMG